VRAAYWMVRLLLMGVIACGIIAVWPVLFSNAGEELSRRDVNEWSGLIGLLLVLGAGVALLGVLAPAGIHANPAAALVTLVPLVAMALVPLSSFDAPPMAVVAVVGAVLAGAAFLVQQGLGPVYRRRERRLGAARA
jgi:hypothetical protein